MSASVTPMESPDEIPEGKLEHMSSHQHVDHRLNGRLPTDNGVNTGTNKVDHIEDPPELRDNRVNWQHPPTMQVLQARHQQNSDPRPQSPEDYARLHREENARYMREWREKLEEERQEQKNRRREQERARRPTRSPPRHQLSDPTHPHPQSKDKSNSNGHGHTHNFSYEQNPIDPQYIPMPASPPRSDDSRPFIPLPASPARSDGEKPLPVDPKHGQTRQLEIPGFQEGSPFRESANYSDHGGQGYDLGILGGELTPQVSYRSVRSRERHGSVKSHQSRPETGNRSVRSDEYTRSGEDYGKGEVSPLERNETPEVHEARMEQLVRAQRGDAREWHDMDGRRF